MCFKLWKLGKVMNVSSLTRNDRCTDVLVPPSKKGTQRAWYHIGCSYYYWKEGNLQGLRPRRSRTDGLGSFSTSSPFLTSLPCYFLVPITTVYLSALRSLFRSCGCFYRMLGVKYVPHKDKRAIVSFKNIIKLTVFMQNANFCFIPPGYLPIL